MDNSPAVQDDGELRVILYSHDSQGLGHTRRNLAIAHALANRLPTLLNRKVTGLLVSGVGSAAGFTAPVGWDWVVLPGVRKSGPGYTPRDLGVNMRRLTTLRSHLLEAAFTSFVPHLIIVDRHAYGVDGELVQALAEVRRTNYGCRVVLGLRDVLDSPDVIEREWQSLGSVTRLRESFDELWVYGDPLVHDPVDSGEIPATLADKVAYTGYLSTGRTYVGQPGEHGTGDVEAPYLLTMAGGGSDGLALTTAAAHAIVPKGYHHIIVTGPQMSAAHRREVERAAGPRTRVLASVPDALPYVREASALVSMGGYNSICEILSTTTPALVVPRVQPRREQLIRARAMERRNLLEVCPPHQLTVQRLGDWFQRVAGSRRRRQNVDLAGLAAVTRLACELRADVEQGSAAHGTTAHGTTAQGSVEQAGVAKCSVEQGSTENVRGAAESEYSDAAL